MCQATIAPNPKAKLRVLTLQLFCEPTTDSQHTQYLSELDNNHRFFSPTQLQRRPTPQYTVR